MTGYVSVPGYGLVAIRPGESPADAAARGRKARAAAFSAFMARRSTVPVRLPAAKAAPARPRVSPADTHRPAAVAVSAETCQLAERVLYACAAHLQIPAPSLTFMRAFDSDHLGECDPDGGICVKASLTGAELVEVVSHEVAHAAVARRLGGKGKALTDRESPQGRNNEALAWEYGRAARRWWEYQQERNPSDDFADTLRRYVPRPDLSARGLR